MPTRPHTLEAAIEGVSVHDHLCLLYESRAEQFAAVLPFVRHGEGATFSVVFSEARARE